MTARFPALISNIDLSSVNRRLPGIATLALIVLTALVTAQLIWLVLTPQTDSAQPMALSSAHHPAATASRPDLSTAIVSAHLFGSAKENVAKLKPVEAPETRLNLKLRGVYATDDENKGYALIASGTGQEKLYATGQSLPGNTRLKAVFPDRVILDRKGRYETLRMLDTKVSGGSTYIPRQSGTSSETRQLGANSRVVRLRSEILRNPRKLAELVSAQPAYENGIFAGYRITTRRPDPVFDELNLKSGDIITQVNGIAIDSPQKGLQALRQLSRASQASVTIKRDGQYVQLNLSL